jgi:hypothetical protein
MSIMLKTLLLVALLFAVTGQAVPNNPSTEMEMSLAAGFLNPPKDARPSTYYLLLNGYMNRAHVDQELEQLHSVGIRGLCVFDMGARGRADALPPKGPAFMSKEWIENFSYVLRKAGALDMDVQLAVSSSWDMGASWVKAQEASKALYHSTLSIEGPTHLDMELPFPDIPAKAPRDKQGRLLYSKDVAVLALPTQERQSGHEFVLKLPPGRHSVDHVVLYNTPSDDPKRHGPLHLFAKDFSVAVSETDVSEGSFREILRDSLEPNTKAQRFAFPATQAKYVSLSIYNGHNPEFDAAQLGEFELYSTEGRNLAGSHEADRTQAAATLLRFSGQRGHDGVWTADNINDGLHSGPRGSWSSAGLPPLIIREPDTLIDLSRRLDDDGRLKWEVPLGAWTILRFVCCNTGERLKVPSPVSDGLATDHFSSQVTENYIRTLTDRLQEQLGDLAKTVLTQLYLPSYEVRGALWTDDLIDRFKAYRDYDPLPYLPVLTGYVIKNRDITERFLYDFHKTLGDLLVDAYYRTASISAQRVGLGIEAESGGPGPPVHQVPVDALKALGAIDEMRGEFWPWRNEAAALWVVKETACAAHVYGRRRVHMESFTGFRHWEDGPFDLKPSADRAFCEGMNHVVWHTSSHQPPEAGRPGWVYGAGTHLTPNLVWWPYAKPFIDYLSRCSFMLQQGRFVADVCYYYGDQAFNFVPPKHIDPALGYGYDYDVANPEVILERMSVQDDRISLPDGMQYELLVLPERQDIDLQVLRKIAALVRAGATVVGPKPTRANGLEDYLSRERQIRQLADALWGPCDGKTVHENAYGKGRVIWGPSLREILLARGIGPDFSCAAQANNTDIDYIHRRSGQSHIYFVRNRSRHTKRIEACFRVTGKTPELWRPDTGRIQELSVYQQTNSGVRVPLTLAPVGSIFVVFRSPADPAHLVSAEPELLVTGVTGNKVQVTVDANGGYQLKTGQGQSTEFSVDRLPAALRLTGPWEVSFNAESGATDSVTFAELTSWTDHALPGVRYFSGVARYSTEFEIPADWQGRYSALHLELGRLWAVGELRLNGHRLGVLWKPPYRVKVTDAVHAGSNRLEVDIANTWANRLVGDALSPQTPAHCRTNITRSGTPGRAWKDLPLRPSGLLGPVVLVPAIEETVMMTK